MFGNSSRPLKIVLSVLFVVALFVLVLVILMQRGLIGKKTTSVDPAATTAATGIQKQAGDAGMPIPPSSSPVISPEEAAKQAQTLRDQVNAGTLSRAEAEKQLNTMQIAPPALPPEVQKQIDAAKSAQR